MQADQTVLCLRPGGGNRGGGSRVLGPRFEPSSTNSDLPLRRPHGGSSSFKMSLTADSPVHSSSSDEFAAFLDAELDSASDVDEVESGEAEGEEEVEDEDNDTGDGDGSIDSSRSKKRKIELIEGAVDPQSSVSRGEPAETSGASMALDVCTHPGVMGGMCIRCGQKVEDESGVAFGYIHKNLRLADDEVARLREKDLKNLLRHRKLILVLDLDHTLLNSTRLADISAEESYLKDQREVLPAREARIRKCRPTSSMYCLGLFAVA